MAELVFSQSDFCPDVVFGCGQTFRFHRDAEGVWSGTAHGVPVECVPSGDDVVFRAEGPKDQWLRYTDMDRNYDTLFEDADDVLARALQHGKGLRVLRQEPFETLISFIISANNNIPRISGIIERLCAVCWPDHPNPAPFPSPEQIAALSEVDLRALGAGYRAAYIRESAMRAADTDFAELSGLPYPKVREALLAFKGVGPKVADCIALFGLGKTEAFPVDVWVRRILEQLYGVRGTAAEMRRFAEERYGQHAGIAQQYLFHYARSHLERGT